MLKRDSRLIETFTAERITGTTLNVGDHAEEVTGSVVSANYFDAIGVHPILGRGFAPDEEIGNKAHPVTVIAYQMWRQRYGGRSQHHRQNATAERREAHHHRRRAGGVLRHVLRATSFQFWVPVSMEALFSDGDYKLENRGARWIEGFCQAEARCFLIVQAQAEVSVPSPSGWNMIIPRRMRVRDSKLYPLWATPFNAKFLHSPAHTAYFDCGSGILCCWTFARMWAICCWCEVPPGGRRWPSACRLGRDSASTAETAPDRRVSADIPGGCLRISDRLYRCRNLIVPTPALRTRCFGESAFTEIDWRVMAMTDRPFA